jgi:hypothetical protein
MPLDFQWKKCPAWQNMVEYPFDLWNSRYCLQCGFVLHKGKTS